MDPHDPTRRRLRIGLAGMVGLGAVGGVAWLLADGEENVAAGGTTTSTTLRPTTVTQAPTTTAEPATTTTTPAADQPTTTSTTADAGLVVPVICREAWGAQPAAGPFTEHTIERITVHHTAALLEDNRLAPGLTQQHQADHQGLGWPDVAYHYLIDRNGHVYEGRPHTAVGDTRTSYDPPGHLLIAAKGNFEEQERTPTHPESLVAMVAWGVSEFDVPPSAITGHRDWAATACPGESLYATIASGDLAAAVAEEVEGGPATLEVACGEDASQLVAAIEAGSA